MRMPVELLVLVRVRLPLPIFVTFSVFGAAALKREKEPSKVEFVPS